MAGEQRLLKLEFEEVLDGVCLFLKATRQLPQKEKRWPVVVGASVSGTVIVTVVAEDVTLTEVEVWLTDAVVVLVSVWVSVKVVSVTVTVVSVTVLVLVVVDVVRQQGAAQASLHPSMRATPSQVRPAIAKLSHVAWYLHTLFQVFGGHQYGFCTSIADMQVRIAQAKQNRAIFPGCFALDVEKVRGRLSDLPAPLSEHVP